MMKRGMPPLKLSAGRKNKRGVSPIIATILLVAITVVIAAVLYVLVRGYLKGTGSAPLSINLQSLTTGHNGPKTAYYLNFSTISASNSMTTNDFGWKIVNVNGNAVVGWKCYLYWGTTNVTSFSAGGSSWGATEPVNASDSMVFWTGGTNLVGSGDSIQAVGLSGASVSGGYQGL